jgi:protein required for attachment to host cells
MTTWLLVADSVRGRVFQADSPTGPLTEIITLAHPEGRLHEQALTSDLPGRTFDRGGQGRHVMEDRISAKEQGNIRFALRIAEHLELMRVEGKFERLIIVAPPEFLGILSAKLSDATRKLVSMRLDKNLAQKSAKEIRNHLPEQMWGTPTG